MPRPKSDDPKRAVTLRLPSSVLARYETAGSGYRAKMEAVLVAAVRQKISAQVADAPQRRVSMSLPIGPAPVVPGSRLKRR